jgi:hypothetical protein
MKRRHPLVVAVALAAAALWPLPLLADPIAMGPQAMEGALKVSPGTVLMAGYDFTIPGAHPAETVQFTNAQVVFQAQCAGGGGGVIVVPLGDSTTFVPAKSSAWYPSGDQHSPAVYQGSFVVPDICGGETVSLRSGGTFSADLASDGNDNVHVRWHYSANGTSGSWSGTGSFRPGPLEPPHS